jgi:hypothetical protein
VAEDARPGLARGADGAAMRTVSKNHPSPLGTGQRLRRAGKPDPALQI